MSHSLAEASHQPRFSRSLVCRSSLIDVILETVLKLSSLAQLDVFLLMEKDDCRVFAGKDKFCQSYVEGSLADSGRDVRLDCDLHRRTLRVKERENPIERESGSHAVTRSKSKKSSPVKVPSKRRRADDTFEPYVKLIKIEAAEVETEEASAAADDANAAPPDLNFIDDKMSFNAFDSAEDENWEEDVDSADLISPADRTSIVGGISFVDRTVDEDRNSSLERISVTDQSPSNRYLMTTPATSVSQLSLDESSFDLSWLESHFFRNNPNYDKIRQLKFESELRINSVTRRAFDRLLYRLGRETGDRFIASGLAESEGDFCVDQVANAFCLSFPNFRKVSEFRVAESPSVSRNFYDHVRSTIETAFKFAFVHREKKERAISLRQKVCLSQTTYVNESQECEANLTSPNDSLESNVPGIKKEVKKVLRPFNVSWIADSFIVNNDRFEFLSEATGETDFSKNSESRKVLEALIYRLGKEACVQFMNLGYSDEDSQFFSPYVEAILKKFCHCLPNYDELLEIKMKDGLTNLLFTSFMKRGVRKALVRALQYARKRALGLRQKDPLPPRNDDTDGMGNHDKYTSQQFNLAWIVDSFILNNERFDLIAETSAQTDFAYPSESRKVFEALIYRLGKEAGVQFFNEGFADDDRELVTAYVEAVTKQFCLCLPNFEELKNIKLQDGAFKLLLASYIKRGTRKGFSRNMDSLKKK